MRIFLILLCLTLRVNAMVFHVDNFTTNDVPLGVGDFVIGSPTGVFYCRPGSVDFVVPQEAGFLYWISDDSLASYVWDNGYTYSDGSEMHWRVTFYGVPNEGGSIQAMIQTVQDLPQVFSEQQWFLSGFSWALPLVGLMAMVWVIKKGIQGRDSLGSL